MIITHIDIYEHKIRNGLILIGCRIHTDEGIYGDGEVGLAYGWIKNSAIGALMDSAEQIVGMNPLEHEVIWHYLYKESFWGQNGGPSFYGSLSAIDIALWDIKGKYFNVPVSTLLGGKMRDKIRCYASHIQYGWDSLAGPDRLVNGRPKREDYPHRAMLAVADGFSAVKLDIWEFDDNGNYTEDDHLHTLITRERMHTYEQRLSDIRQAVGPNTDIILDAHACMSADAAIQFAEMAKKYHIYYLEEPTLSSPELAEYVRNYVDIPLAYGERIYSRWQYRPYFEKNSIQIAQPDIGNTGGITEAKKIADMAKLYDINIQLHSCSSPLSVFASLQLEAVLPNFEIHEYFFEQPNQYMKQTCKYDYETENGYITVPDRPGLGNEWSEYFLTVSKKTVITKSGCSKYF